MERDNVKAGVSEARERVEELAECPMYSNGCACGFCRAFQAALDAFEAACRQEAEAERDKALEGLAHHRWCRACAEDGCASCYECRDNWPESGSAVPAHGEPG